MKALFVLFISLFISFDSVNVFQKIQDRLNEIEEEKVLLREMEIFNELTYGPFSERMEEYSDIVEKVLRFEERTKEKVCLMVDNEDHNGALFHSQELLYLAMADRFFLPENNCSIVIIDSHSTVLNDKDGVAGTFLSFTYTYDHKIKSLFPEIQWGFGGCRAFKQSGCEDESCYNKSNPKRNNKARWDGTSFYYTEDGDFSYSKGDGQLVDIDHLFN
jgi:hypothetical protein